MKSEFPLVSIITVNYNGTGLTIELLKSVDALTYPKIEVIVVDNGSKIDPGPIINSQFPNVKVVRSEKNLGFAGGNNLGMNIAQGEYFFLVNNDTELTPNSIRGLVDIFKDFPDAGIVSPKFHYFFSPNTIEYAGYRKVNRWTGRNKMIGCKETDLGQYNFIKETTYCHGGGMMLPASLVNEVGLMPEPYFLYYEEFDWCEQIKRAGYKIYYQPNSLIYHKESMTTGKNSKLKTYYLTRNRVLFMRRNGNSITKVVFLAYLICFTIPKNTIMYLLRRDVHLLLAFWRGIYWNIRHLNLKNVNFRCAE